jgi:hypothetical protein
VGAGGGRDFAAWGAAVRATAERARTVASLTEYAVALARAVEAVEVATKSAWAGEPGEALANATPYLQAFGHTVIAWMWLDVAIAAARALEAGGPPGADFHRGKLHATRYFFRYELPKIGAWLDVVARRDDVPRRGGRLVLGRRSPPRTTSAGQQIRSSTLRPILIRRGGLLAAVARLRRRDRWPSCAEREAANPIDIQLAANTTPRLL